mgnify:CR=1 FL=1
MAMRSNRQIVKAAGSTITTAGLAAGGALNPEQARRFIQQTFDATPLGPLVRHEMRVAKNWRGLTKSDIARQYPP